MYQPRHGNNLMNRLSCAGSPDYVCFWVFWIGEFGLLGDTTAFTLKTKLTVLAISAVGLAASEASPRRRAAHHSDLPRPCPGHGST